MPLGTIELGRLVRKSRLIILTTWKSFYDYHLHQNVSHHLIMDFNLLVKSKISPRSGSVVLRQIQINPIHKKGP